MTKHFSFPPTGIPESQWKSALVQAKVSNKPFLIKRFDHLDTTKTYVFFGQLALPLRLALPMMMRLHEPMALRKHHRQLNDSAIHDYFAGHTWTETVSGVPLGEIVYISGSQHKAQPKMDSYYGLTTYIKDRYEADQQDHILVDFLAALRA